MPCSCCNRCGRCITASTPWGGSSVNHDYRTQAECESCPPPDTVETLCDGTCPEGYWLVDDWGQQIDVDVSADGCYGNWGARTTAVTGCGAIQSVVQFSPGAPGTWAGYGARLGRVAPTVTASVSSAGGSGAVLSVSLEAMQDECGFDYWRISGISVTSPGSGYSTGDTVIITAATGDTVAEAATADLSVTSGTASGVTVTNPGVYFREDASVAPYVAVPTVTVTGGSGTGAVIHATVNSDTSSPDFGFVSLTVLDGGSGYGPVCASAASGCPCGTWVVDNNQEPCKCCKWELGEGSTGIAYCPDPQFGQEYHDSVIATLEAEGDAIRDRLDQLRDDFEAAGWTVQYDDNWVFEPPEGCIYIYGFKFSAKCEECERAYPRPLSNWPSSYYHVHGPCDPDQWVMIPYERFVLGTYAGSIGPIGCRNEDGTWRALGNQWDYSADVWSERGGALENYGSAYGNVWIPKCGQRITECVCCTNYELEWWDPLRRVTRDCWGECPPGYTAEGPGACDNPGNPFP